MSNGVLWICCRMRTLLGSKTAMKVMKLNYETSSKALDLILYSYIFSP